MSLTAKNLKASFTAISVGLVLATHAFAQVSTPIVGFQKRSISPGFSSVAFPLLNQDVSTTTASAVSGNSITLSGVTNAGGLLTSGEPYYLEVRSGSLKGDRFDLNTAATITAANDTVVLDSASQNNTYPVANIGTALNGASISIRKHLTLDQIRLMANPALTGNNNPASADQVQVFETSGFVAYSLRTDNTWRKSGSTNNFAKLPIPPGAGVVINKRGTSGVELMQTGTVRQNDFALPYKTGLQFVAPSVPVDRSAANIGVAPNTNGWVGNNNPSLADQIMVFENGTFVAYSLRNDGQLRRSGNTNNFISQNILGASEAWIIKRQNSNSDNIETQIVQ